MNDELKKLFDRGETGTVEFKQSFGKEAIETIAAFSNSEGGFLCIGLNDDGSFCGRTFLEEQVKDWLNQLKMATEPSLFPEYRIEECEEGSAVSFVVQEYPIKPVACKGRYFKRHGASNHALTSDEIVELKLQSLNMSFDSFSVTGGIDKLDAAALAQFERDIELSGRFKPSGIIANDLEKLGFVKEGQVTRAAELLFGNHHTSIHIGRFKSRDTIIDDLVIRAPLVLAIDEAMEFMKKNMRLGYEFGGELKRKEKWQFPLPVLRELLLNSIIHKDYRDPTDVIIKLFDEHVEFVNPGELFGSLKLEALQTDFYRASHRNKLLAEGFYLSGEVEKYGTGFVRIRERLNKEAPGLKLSFREDVGAFWVSLEGVPDGQANAAEKSSQKSSQKILEAMAENPHVTIAQLAELCGIGTRAVQKNVDLLRERGRLCRVGPDKGGHWEVVRVK